MKYVLFTEKRGDVFSEEFDSLAAAIQEANADWHRLPDRDKLMYSTFEIIKSVNEDEEAENHFDGDVVWKAVI